ncbi:hypothetical protein [Streptacidiphilus anmyonensis]|uniref:hypothetical protein n=1 Tax=Streptacidiphilus anmyonensis TaxID=405782 RepID=UPI000AD08E50|nr:hypothetical protein [Streptacidiphilus anmyonensis]
MKLGKLVATGVAEDVVDATVEEAPPTPETDTALPLRAETVTAETVTAGSSTER